MVLLLIVLTAEKKKQQWVLNFDIERLMTNDHLSNMVLSLRKAIAIIDFHHCPENIPHVDLQKFGVFLLYIILYEIFI